MGEKTKLEEGEKIVEVCYVEDPRGKKHLFKNQIIVIKNVGHIWGKAETGDEDIKERPLLSVAKNVKFNESKFTSDDVFLDRVKLSKNKKRVIGAEKKLHSKKEK